MKLDNNQSAFFELLKAGLWGDVNSEIRIDGTTDWNEVYQLAQEQSVQGLVLQGIDSFRLHVPSFKIPQLLLLQWIGEVKIIEQQNKEMNIFVADLIEKLRKYDIYAILVKGQGIAQCYERPNWRMNGDVDLLLSNDNYEAAKRILISIATKIDEEQNKKKHLALTIDNWTVELHGSLRTNLWNKLERVMDEVQGDVFYGGNVRSWENGNTQVFLMRADEDVVFVFAHILQHFFIEGIGLRQICDWCRLLFKYKDSINHNLLESRLRKGGMMKEWKAFGAFAVDYLGMPVEAMPFYDSRFKVHGSRVMELVLDSGNFGQGKDNSYKERHSKGVRYCISFGKHAKEGFRRFSLFPAHALLMWWKLMLHGLKGVIGIGKNDGGL